MFATTERVKLDPEVTGVITAHCMLCNKCQERLNKKVVKLTIPKDQSLPL